MDNYPEPCMCGAIDCRICGPLQGYRVKSTAQLWDCEDGYEDEDEDDDEGEGEEEDGG